MDPLPLHPKLVHLPIALAVLAPLLALGVIAAWRTAFLPRRSWILVVVLQALLVGSGWAALSTGQDEENTVGRVVERPRSFSCGRREASSCSPSCPWCCAGRGWPRRRPS